jgi:inner membrane protein
MDEITYWHWFILAATLIILEVFAPGAFFLWLGIAAALVGAMVLLLPALSWEYQVLMFSVLSVVSIVVWRKYIRGSGDDAGKLPLNRRGEHYLGRRFTLKEPIVDGLGKIRVDDSTWKVRGPDCPAGTHVEVTGVDGTILLVQCNPPEGSEPSEPPPPA